MSISVYTKSSSEAVRATCKQLEEGGIEFYAYDLAEHPDAIENIVRDGFHQAPVVYTPFGNWSGHNEDKINALIVVIRGEGKTKDSQLTYNHAREMLRED